MRILLIEDSRQDSELIRRALTDFQCEVQTAESLKEALAAKSVFQPDIIILDVELPDSTRATLRAAIAQMRGQAALIILSGHADENSIPECTAAGADDYIEKTLLSEDPRKFLLRISRAWSSYKARTIVLPRSDEVDRDMTNAQKKLLSSSQRVPDVERDASLGVEQNFQILIQLAAIEKEVRHTNGTVREHSELIGRHTLALHDMTNRHQHEDETRAAAEKVALAKMTSEAEYRKKVLSNLRWIGGMVLTGMIGLVGDWFGHWMHWK